MPAPVAAPTAPVSKPAASPTPSPAKASDATPPQPIEKQIEFDSDIDAELASMDDEKPRQAPPQKAQPKPAVKPPVKPQPKPEVVDPEKESDEPGEEDPDNEPGEVDKSKEGKTGEPVKPAKAADLRTAYEGLKKKVKEEFEPKVAKLESRIKELESGGSEQVSVLQKQLEEKVKRLESLENDMRFIDYKKSSEYIDKYEKPYQEAWAKAQADLDELTVPNDDGTSRKAEMADLLHLANLPLGEARTVARQMFGDAADDVMAHRREIRNLSQAQEKALKDAKANASEHEKKLAAQREIQNQEISRLWTETNQSLSQKYPKWFAEQEGDVEGNELLRKGFSLADLHFLSEKAMSPEAIEQLPPRFRDAIKANGGVLPIKERVALDALLRNKIASHTRIARDLKKATARIKELEKSLSEYEDSGPNGKPKGGSGGDTTSNPYADAEAEIDSIDRKNS